MTTLDLWLFKTINGLAGRSALVDSAMVMLANASTLLIPVALVFAYVFWRDWREALVLAATFGGLFAFGDMVGAQVKHLIARVRPCHVLGGIHELVGCGGTSSFPSNHALNTAAAAALAQVLVPATGWITWPLVVIVGFARVYVGAHYVTDVVGGWLIGGVLGVAVAWLLRRLYYLRPTSEPSKPAV